MKRLFILSAIFAIWSILGATPVDAAYNPYATVVIEAKKDMPRFVEEKLPTYVKKWDRLKTDAEPIEIFNRWIDVQNYVFSYYNQSSYFISGKGISFTVKVPNRNAEFPITMNEFRFIDGKIIFHHNYETEEMSPEEFEKIKFSWANKIVESAEYLTNLTTDARDKIIKNIEDQLVGFNSLKEGESLEKKLTSFNSNIPADELMFIPPQPNFNDFIPTEVIISPMGGNGSLLFGISLVDCGVVYYHPAAMINEYNELGDTSTHELWHRNIYFQGLLLGSFFDKELWASYIERFGYANSLLFHPYQEPTRKIARVTTSFDPRKALNDTLYFNPGEIKISDPETFNAYWREAEKIKKEYQKIMLKRFLPELYANPFFYSCLNDDMLDQNGGFKLFFYAKNAFTLLGGPEKTQEWLIEHESILKETLQEAKKKLGETDKKAVKYGNEEKRRMISIAKICANTLGITYSNEEELLSTFKQMLDQGVISFPQIEIPLRDAINIIQMEGK